MEEAKGNPREVVYIDGSRGLYGYEPVAVSYKQIIKAGDRFTDDNLVVDPIFTDSVYNNLYGRLMTLVEATTESYKLKAVKDLFSKELKHWSSDVFESARDIATSNYEDTGHSINQSNIYIRR